MSHAIARQFVYDGTNRLTNTHTHAVNLDGEVYILQQETFPILSGLAQKSPAHMFLLETDTLQLRQLELTQSYPPDMGMVAWMVTWNRNIVVLCHEPSISVWIFNTESVSWMELVCDGAIPRGEIMSECEANLRSVTCAAILGDLVYCFQSLGRFEEDGVECCEVAVSELDLVNAQWTRHVFAQEYPTECSYAIPFNESILIFSKGRSETALIFTPSLASWQSMFLEYSVTTQQPPNPQPISRKSSSSATLINSPTPPSPSKPKKSRMFSNLFRNGSQESDFQKAIDQINSELDPLNESTKEEALQEVNIPEASCPCLIEGSKILFFSGSYGKLLSCSTVIDLSSGIVSQLPHMTCLLSSPTYSPIPLTWSPNAREHHATVALNDSTALVIGGVVSGGTGAEVNSNFVWTINLNPSPEEPLPLSFLDHQLLPESSNRLQSIFVEISSTCSFPFHGTVIGTFVLCKGIRLTHHAPDLMRLMALVIPISGHFVANSSPFLVDARDVVVYGTPPGIDTFLRYQREWESMIPMVR
eukprot:c7735_g1_i2.p1 GENE.c7735_g1_i2~~c7735_g1_i2.p1  ORF type:complete len:531 (-),score=144.65 c7735_g1_i2:15-1607(-)